MQAAAKKPGKTKPCDPSARLRLAVSAFLTLKREHWEHLEYLSQWHKNNYIVAKQFHEFTKLRVKELKENGHSEAFERMAAIGRFIRVTSDGVKSKIELYTKLVSHNRETFNMIKADIDKYLTDMGRPACFGDSGAAGAAVV